MKSRSIIEYPIRLILGSVDCMNILYEVNENKAEKVTIYYNNDTTLPTIESNIEFSNDKNCVVIEKTVSEGLLASKTDYKFVKAFIKR